MYRSDQIKASDVPLRHLRLFRHPILAARATQICYLGGVVRQRLRGPIASPLDLRDMGVP